MATDQLTDDALRAVVVDSLVTQPGATLTHIQNRLRARVGRVLVEDELQRLQEIYSDEGFAASASAVVSDEAERAATRANLMHARPTAKEILGLVAAILPFLVHFQSSTGTRPGAAATSYFDLVALAGGAIAIVLGIGAAARLEKGPQRVFHLGLVAIVLGIGLYQVLLGAGLLHRLGVFHYS